MNREEPSDDLLRALSDLQPQQPDAARSRAILVRAIRTIERRRRLAQQRLVLVAAVYGRVVAPIAAGALAAGFIAAALAQAILVVLAAHGGVFGV